MTAPNDLQDMIGRTAVDPEGNKIGKVGQIYLDDQTGQPQWVTVSTGMFGTKESFAPIYGSQTDGDDVVLGVSKDLVKDAPRIDADGAIDAGEVDALYTHYGPYLGESGRSGGDNTVGTETTGTTESTDTSETAGTTSQVTDGEVSDGHDMSGPDTDDAMTRSEERLHVGTEKVDAGRARLRKYVVTENVTTTVPVSHEEVRVEREPMTEENRDAAISGGDITEEEHEVTLHRRAARRAARRRCRSSGCG